RVQARSHCAAAGAGAPCASCKESRSMLKLLSMLFAAGKLGKLLTTGGTMIVSVLAYALVWGLPYAFGLVLLIFVHEMGHYLAARRRGLEVGAPTFIPFVGAWVAMKDMPRDVETEAYVGLAGPV